MNPKIQTPKKKSGLLTWPHILDELRNDYCLYQQSLDQGDKILKRFLLSEKIDQVLSFLQETEILVSEEDIEDLTQILNELTSSEIPFEQVDEITVKIEESDDVDTLIFEDTDEDYLDFTKRIEMTKEDLKKMSTIQDYPTKKAAFEELMTRKLGLQEAIELKERLNDLSSDFYLKEIRILEDNIKPCEIWCGKMRDFLGQYEEYVVDDEFKIESSQRGEILRGIKVLKEEMNILILKDPDLENKFAVFSWMFQAKLFVQGEPQSDVKYWKDWIKKAEEGKRKEILESERYKELCKEVKIYQSLISQVKKIEGQEKLLLQPGSHRKDLKELETIESLLKKLKKCNILSSKEEVYLQNLVDQASNAAKQYETMRESYTRIPLKKFQPIAKRLKELPVKFSQEIEEQIIKEVRINELLKVKQEAAAELRFNIAQKISDEYEGCFIDISEAQAISNAYNQVVKVLKTIEDGFKDKGTLSYEVLCELEQQVENTSFDLGSSLSAMVKIKIWQAKVELISFLKENVEIVLERPIPFGEVSLCLNEGYAYLDHANKDMLVACQVSIHLLEDLLRNIDEFFTKINQMEDPRKERSPFSRFIDMEEKIAELKIGAVQRRVEEQSSLLHKRREPSPLIETAASSLEMESEGDTSSHDEVLIKKVRTEEGFFGIEQIVSQKTVSQDVEEEKVTIGKVLEFVEILKNPQDVVKELENQMVMSCQWNTRDSRKKAETVCDSLKKLRENILLVEQLFKQKFTDGEIEKCLEKKDVEPEEEFKMQPFQSQVQSNEELRIPPPQIQLGSPTELDRIEEIIISNEKEKDTESLTKQFAQEIENNQNCELPLKDEKVPFKHLYNHPLYRRPKQRYSRCYYPPKLRYFPENLPNHQSRDQPKDSLKSPDFDLINDFNQHSNPPLPIDSLKNQNQNDKIDADWKNFMIKFSQAREADELKNREITQENLKNPEAIDHEQFEEMSNVNDKNPQNINNQLDTYDSIIKQIFRGRITQQTKERVSELSGSLHTYASLDHLSKFPKISIPELRFHQDFLHKFCINLNRLKKHEKSQFKKVLIGWVSVETADPHPLAWAEKNNIGKCSDIPGVEIYLMPLSSDDETFERLKSDLNWTYHENKSASVPERYLLFAICLTTKPLHGNLKNSKLMALKKITRQLNKQNLTKPNQQRNLQNDLIKGMSGLFKKQEGEEMAYNKKLERLLEQETPEIFEISEDRKMLGQLSEQEKQETSEASEVSLDIELIKAFEHQEQEKPEIKIREKSHRQRKAPVLFAPGWKAENIRKGKRVDGEKGEKKKRGRSFKQNPSVSMPKSFELKLVMKMEE